MQKDKTELEVTRMTKENIQYLDVFFAVCKRYKVDYYQTACVHRCGCSTRIFHETSARKRAEPFLGSPVYGHQTQRTQ